MLTDRDESCRGCERGAFDISNRLNMGIGHLTILRQQKLIDSSRIGACFLLPQPAHIEAKEVILCSYYRLARFKVHYAKRLYKNHLLPPINVITEEFSNQNHQPDSYRSATRKMMQET